MDKKEESINRYIGRAISYLDKANGELQIALNIALEGKGLSDEEKQHLTVCFAHGNKEVVKRVNDGSVGYEYAGPLERFCRISNVYRMTGAELRKYFSL